MGSPSFIGASSVVPPRLLCPPRRFENTAFKNFDYPSRGGIEAPLEVGSWVQGLNWRGFPSRMAAGDTRDWRERRDGRRFEVRSSRFSELQTLNFEFRIAPVARLSNWQTF